MEGCDPEETEQEVADVEVGTPSGGDPGCRLEDADTALAALEPTPDEVFV
jgi:hypothetical protein